MTSFHIRNFGCRVNQAEAFAWAHDLEEGGLRLEEDAGRADWVIVNTCTLTAKADRDVRKFLRRVSRLNPQAGVIVAGCALETGALGSLPDAAWQLVANAEKEWLPRRILSQVGERKAALFKPSRARALLKVQDGCSQRCSFCVIPKARGGGWSVEKAEVLSRARALAGRGYREIVLCGIHLSSYGLDLKPRSSLAALLADLTELGEVGRIRLSSLDPRFLRDGLADLLTANPKICPHFHLSLQHGCDRILNLMGRDSKTAEYSELLDRLRRGSPAAALGADVMVGFPGETEADFEEMRAFLEDSRLDYLHVFSYSPRPGTEAAAWPQVEEAEKKRRSAELRKLSEARRRAFGERFLGQTLDAIVIKRINGGAEVLTSNYINIRVPDSSGEPGEETKARIVRLDSQSAWGEKG